MSKNKRPEDPKKPEDPIEGELDAEALSEISGGLFLTPTPLVVVKRLTLPGGTTEPTSEPLQTSGP